MGGGGFAHTSLIISHLSEKISYRSSLYLRGKKEHIVKKEERVKEEKRVKKQEKEEKIERVKKEELKGEGERMKKEGRKN